MNQDIRWIQRFSNYRKALAQLQKFIDKKTLAPNAHISYCSVQIEHSSVDYVF